MHELSITQNIVAIAAEHAGERTVRCVRLQIGALSGVQVEAIRFCFDVCAKGTILEGATLEIDEVPGKGLCTNCQKEIPLTRLVGVCPCEKRARVNIVQGEELLIKEMEMETCA